MSVVHPPVSTRRDVVPAWYEHLGRLAWRGGSAGDA